MSAWRPSVSITEREFVRGPQPWRLAQRTGWQQQTLGRWSIPVWRRGSGASTKNSPVATSAPTTMSAFSVLQVALMTAIQGCTSCHTTDMSMQENTCMNTHFPIATCKNNRQQCTINILLFIVYVQCRVIGLTGVSGDLVQPQYVTT